MRLGLLASLSEATGNNVTAVRIAGFFRDAGNTIELIDINAFPDSAAFRAWTCCHQPFDGYIGIHAFRAGRLLIGVARPSRFIIIFGGTDVNEHIFSPQKLPIMREACRQASTLICFSEEIRNLALQVC